jgi:membrane protease YdiL (CAAX protease family)
VRWQGPADGTPERWPAGYAPLAFAAAFIVAPLCAGIIVALTAVAGAEAADPGVTVASMLAFDGALVVVAWLVAARLGHVRVRAGDFGLTRLPLGRAAGWTAAALAAWYAFTVLYAALLNSTGRQNTLDALGANDGIGLLIAATLLLVLIAPLAEEIFFRGLCYRALRNRLGRWTSALTVGVVFGAIHYDGPDTLALIAPLAVLGALFCLLYELTGSLYPSIAVHVVNNAVALAITADASAAPIVAAIVATIGLAGCATLSRAPPTRYA